MILDYSKYRILDILTGREDKSESSFVKMMESYGGMRPVSEDNLSNGSGSDHSETNLRPASPGSESLPLRFANAGGGRVVTIKRQKAVITTLAFTALVIVSTVFGTLYFNSENGNELVKKSGS